MKLSAIQRSKYSVFREYLRSFDNIITRMHDVITFGSMSFISVHIYWSDILKRTLRHNTYKVIFVCYWSDIPGIALCSNSQVDLIISWYLFCKIMLTACSYGKTLSQLARKHLDKFTSEISPSCENRMKSYLTVIWNEKFFRLPRSRLSMGEISVRGKIFAPYENNLFNYFPT